jgi:nucleoside-diphosphate-sugar epimerase
MKILTTGGAGKIGDYVLRELLQSGHRVTDFGRSAPLVPGVEYVAGDVRDLDQVRAACRGFDAIIHLAAVPSPVGIAPPEHLWAVNVTGTFNVLEAAACEKVPKVVFASSGAALGFNFQTHPMTPRYLPIDEEHPCEPSDEYGLSKLIGDLTCKRYADAYGMQAISLRINHNWYLDREGVEVAVRSGWRKTTVEQQWEGYRQNVENPERGGTRTLWAVTDARDAAQALRLAVENDAVRGETFYINGDDTYSFVESQTLVERYFPGVPLARSLPGFATLFSADKAKRMLGFAPRYTWRDSDFRKWLDQR